MLVLGRREGQRTRIVTPCGSTIWVVMRKGHLTVEREGLPTLEADFEDSVWLDYGDDTIEIVYCPESTRFAGNTIGINAPKDYIIRREELIEKMQKSQHAGSHIQIVLLEELQRLKKEREELLSALKTIDDGDVDNIDDAIMVVRKAITKAGD